MLIDATHPEETRVVVTRGNRVEEFDYESATRKQLRGNIYLAKVARIEPSLQAAFVNYGGNRHGFLAFAEIHPDYYQIPVAVREALMREDALDRQGSSHDNGDNGHANETEYPHGAENGGELDEPASGETSPVSLDTQELSAGRGEADSEEQRSETEERSDAQEPQPVAQLEAEAADDRAKPEDEPGTDLQGETDKEPGGSPMALEAALPPTIYEEFAAAVARGEEARDEIPSHPDDVEEHDPANQGEEDRLAEPASDEHLPVQEPPVDPIASAEPNQNAATEEEHAPWESAASDEGGIISVPEPVTPTPVEVVGSEDALEELPQRHKRRWRHYKIQEVIKRNQIVLIQVVKEERGSKGAALTTYLSLAGRYTVLMPNTASGGGISRKITVPADRKRLKEIAQELEVPEGMGLIIRTAGASRTKAEIKRDFEYLLRLWENVRDLTLKSTAPCLVYEEGDLIKRSIRDLYNKDIDEILVAGEVAHRDAKEFMRMLMPSHAKNVQLYKEPEPLFIKYEVERQLNQMFSPVVTLRSGGYIVLNQTEALVAIDVNSGRATREYSIEDTALKTNLEASEEVARQVRLRDLAGLIVIDFIDMDERRNNRAVERKLKECLRHDRARIQVGHISHFGLLEMSRQRLRQGVVEVSTMPCPVCQGVGHIRSTESVALMILRSIEDHLRTQGPANITVSASTEASLYILNHKRAYLRDIEMRYGVTIVMLFDEKAHGAHFALERGAESIPPAIGEQKAIHMEASLAASPEEEEDAETTEAGDKRPQRRKRRRRRGRGDQSFDQPLQNGAGPATEAANEDRDDDEEEEGEIPIAAQIASQPAVQTALGAQSGAETEAESQFRRNRRRGRRGGRRHRDELAGAPEFGRSQQQPDHIPGLGEQPSIDFNHDFPKNLALGPIAPRPVAPESEAADEPENTQSEATVETVAPPEPVAEQQIATLPESDTAPVTDAPAEQPQETSPAPEPDQPAPVEAAVVAPPPAPEPKPKPVRTGPPRKGWWQRRIG
jgi:ribonuclease E